MCVTRMLTQQRKADRMNTSWILFHIPQPSPLGLHVELITELYNLPLITPASLAVACTPFHETYDHIEIYDPQFFSLLTFCVAQ